MTSVIPMVDSRALLNAIAGSSFWESYHASSVASGLVGVHLAVFIEPYLSYVLDGSKTVESRFAKRATAPYKRVTAGDVLLLKRAGGGIEAICRAADAWFYELRPSTLRDIRDRFAGAMRVSSEFIETRSGASFATLIRVDRVERIPSVSVQKRDRRGWVVLQDALANRAPPHIEGQSSVHTQQMRRDVLSPIVVGFGGRSKSGKSHLSVKVAERFGWGRAAFGDHVRHVALARGLDPLNTSHLLTLGADLVDGECEPFCRKVLEAAGWAPGRSAILDGVRHVKVAETIRRLVSPTAFRLIMVVASQETRERRSRDEHQQGSLLLHQIDRHSTARDFDRLCHSADYVADGDDRSKNTADIVTRLIRQWASGALEP